MSELVGRDSELEALHRVVDAGQPALVLVTGHAGSGKSALVRELQLRVAERGWATPAALLVTRDTTPQSFTRSVQKSLSGAAGGFLIDTGPRLDARGLSRGMAATHPGSWTTEAQAERSAVELVERLEGAAPVLIVIDGFRPDEAFGAWFAGTLVPRLRRSGRSVVLAIAQEQEPAAELVAQANERIALGPLDRAAAERFLRLLGMQIEPPLEEAEIAAYVMAVADRPELLPNLHRVLSLAGRATRREGAG